MTVNDSYSLRACSYSLQRSNYNKIFDYLLKQPWCASYTLADLEEQYRNSESYCLVEDKTFEHVCSLRMVTDWNSFGYVTDVITLPAYQGKGLGKLFLDSFFKENAVARIKEIFLISTDDRIYQNYGFKPFRYQNLFYSNSAKNK